MSDLRKEGDVPYVCETAMACAIILLQGVRIGTLRPSLALRPTSPFPAMPRLPAYAGSRNPDTGQARSIPTPVDQDQLPGLAAAVA
jgi:hypothetical protein